LTDEKFDALVAEAKEVDRSFPKAACAAKAAGRSRVSNFGEDRLPMLLAEAATA
jgi:hypothetical protein